VGGRKGKIPGIAVGAGGNETPGSKGSLSGSKGARPEKKLKEVTMAFRGGRNGLESSYRGELETGDWSPSEITGDFRGN